MKAKNYRIGNYIKFGELRHEMTHHDIRNLYESELVNKVPSGSYTEIELTEDLLIKFGFKKVGSNYEKEWLLLHTNIKTGTFDFLLNEPQTGKYKVTILKYVHQLQNLFFAITNTELKLEH